MKHQVFEKAALLSAAIVLAVASTPTGAASTCKGLEKQKCELNTECTWVDGYERKDGVKVSSHCKSIGKKKSSSAK